MISVQECIDILQREFRIPEEEIDVDIENAEGRISSRDVESPINYPQHPRSMMDGYAVHHSLIPGVYEIEENVFADVVPKKKSPIVTYIATGATLPEGCDSVIKVEDTEIVEGGKVNLKAKPKKNQFIRMVGSDIKIGQILKRKGDPIGISDIGVFAQCGILMVKVFNNLFSSRFGVMSTGDEIVDHKDQVDPETRKIRDCNRILIKLELKKFLNCSNIIDFGIQGDDYEGLKKSIVEALNDVDFLFTTGGVSMGRKDYCRPILKEIGKVHFEKVSIKPGKPFTFATIQPDAEKNSYRRKKYVFAMPGNPVSAMTILKVLILPTIEILSGNASFSKKFAMVPVKLMENIKRNMFRDEYIRARIFWDKDHFIAFTTGNQNSSRLLSMQNSNGYLILLKGKGLVKAGSMVSCQLRGSFENFDVTKESWRIEKGKKRVVRSCGCDHSEEEDEEILKKKSTTSSTTKTDDHFGRRKKRSFVPTFGVLTVSDRAFSGEYEDVSGPLIKDILVGKNGWKFGDYKIVPDEKEEIKKVICEWSDIQGLGIIFTTGGTGFSQRDVTPEATKEVVDRDASGLIHGIQSLILPKVPMAILSRATAGIRKKTLIINLPGKPKACKENIEILIKSRISHGIQILRQ